MHDNNTGILNNQVSVSTEASLAPEYELEPVQTIRLKEEISVNPFHQELSHCILR